MEMELDNCSAMAASDALKLVCLEKKDVDTRIVFILEKSSLSIYNKFLHSMSKCLLKRKQNIGLDLLRITKS